MAKRTSKSDSSQNFALDTPFLRSVRPKITTNCFFRSQMEDRHLQTIVQGSLRSIRSIGRLIDWVDRFDRFDIRKNRTKQKCHFGGNVRGFFRIGFRFDQIPDDWLNNSPKRLHFLFLPLLGELSRSSQALFVFGF